VQLLSLQASPSLPGTATQVLVASCSCRSDRCPRRRAGVTVRRRCRSSRLVDGAEPASRPCWRGHATQPTWVDRTPSP
jgi:hypothetical protein